MRILMISPVCPFPVNSGGRVRMIELFRGISRDHEVTLVFPLRPTDPRPPSDLSQARSSILPVESSPIRRVRQLMAVLSPTPYHSSLWYSQSLRRKVTELLSTARFDVAYCHFIHTLPYVGGCGLPVIVDPQNVDREVWLRQAGFYKHQGNYPKYWFARANLWKITRFEGKVLKRLSAMVCVSQADLDTTRAYAGSAVANLLVAPNGVDAEHYKPEPKTTPGDHSIVLGFMGSLNLAVNQDAALILCREVLPRVQARLPDINVSALIIGREPPNSLSAFAQSGPAKNITVVGTVPDVLPYLHQVDILVVPLRHGAGSKLRTLEAFSAGICVVGSPLAFIGIDGLVAGKHALVKDTLEEFVEAICNLAQNAGARRQMAEDARNLIMGRYEWSAITAKLSQQLQSLYGSRPPRAETRSRLQNPTDPADRRPSSPPTGSP